MILKEENEVGLTKLKVQTVHTLEKKFSLEDSGTLSV